MTGVTCASLKRRSGPGMWTAVVESVSANSGSTPVFLGRMKRRSKVECDHSCPFKDTCSFTSPAPKRFQENPSGVGQIRLCVVRNSARVDTKLVSHPMSRLTKKSPPAIQTSTISGKDSLYSVQFQTVKLSHMVLVLETDVLVELVVEV